MRPPAARWRRLALAGVAGLGLAASASGVLSAHPLGNFTINHYAGLRIGLTAIAVDYVLDMAEIPTFQERQRIDANADGTVDAAETEAERLAACGRTAPEVTLAVDGVPLELRPMAAGLSFPLGSSGLETLRLVCEFTASLAAPAGAGATVAFEDRTWSQRIGWREIVAIGDGVTLASSLVPETSVSKRLTIYPQDLLSQPLAMPSASVVVNGAGPAAAPFVAPDAHPLPGAIAPSPAPTKAPASVEPTASSAPSAVPGGIAAPVVSAGPVAPGTPAATIAAPPPASPAIQIGVIPGGVTDDISKILEVKDLTPIAVIGSLLVAAFLGALHAVSPGHGKTVMAAYLVGSRGTARHAVALGLTVTVSHTLGVLGLALVTLSASSIIPPERLYPILGLLSGGLVVAIGLWLLYGRYRIWAATRRDALSHEAQAHDHDALAHSHDGMDHEHTHDRTFVPAPAVGSAAVRRYGGGPAVAMAMSSGPSASAAVAVAPATVATAPAAETWAAGEHSHGGIRHSHLPRSGADLTWRSLFSLGLAGGLVPSASALLLLLGSLAANRPAYGVVLVVAFGAGMAIVLAGVGLVLVYATRFVERVPRGTVGRRLWDVLPVATALVVIGAGIYLTSQAVTQVF